MQAFQHSCGQVIEQHGGHISQYRGDALEVYFGWPLLTKTPPSARFAQLLKW